MGSKRTIGFWIIFVVGLFLLLILILGQTMTFIDYDFTVSIGLQESEELISELGVAVNKGFGVGDTMIYIPLLVIGLIGLWKKKAWGIFGMFGALAITAYWPILSLFIFIFAQGVPDFHITNLTPYAIMLTLITIYSIWGLWYLYKFRKLLADEY